MASKKSTQRARPAIASPTLRNTPATRQRLEELEATVRGLRSRVAAVEELVLPRPVRRPPTVRMS